MLPTVRTLSQEFPLVPPLVPATRSRLLVTLPESISLIRIARSASATNPSAVGSGRIEKEIKVFRGESLLTPFLFANFIGFLKGYFFFYFRSLPLAVSIYSFGARSKISPHILLASGVLKRSFVLRTAVGSGRIEKEISYFIRGEIRSHLFSFIFLEKASLFISFVCFGSFETVGRGFTPAALVLRTTKSIT